MTDSNASQTTDRPLIVSLPPDRPSCGVGLDTYTTVLAGEDTGGAHAFIDMNVPPGGGLPSHAHGFEEMFYVLDGEAATVFDSTVTVVSIGSRPSMLTITRRTYRRRLACSASRRATSDAKVSNRATVGSARNATVSANGIPTDRSRRIWRPRAACSGRWYR